MPDEPTFDTDAVDKELVTGDIGITLVVRRSCMTPRAAEDEWLRSHIFWFICSLVLSGIRSVDL